VKALARHRPELAEDLWAGALDRVGAADVGGDWRVRIDALLDRLETSSPPLADLVARTRLLSYEVLAGEGV
jgi:hypothetical protein